MPRRSDRAFPQRWVRTPSRPRNSNPIVKWAKPALPILVAVLVWWIITTYLLVNARIYPTPVQVAGAFGDILKGEAPFGTSYGHLGATLRRLVIAFAVAYVIGTVLGVLAGRMRWFFDFTSSFAWIAFAVPSVVWVFIFLIVFGISEVVPIAAMVVLLSAPVYLGAAESVKAVPRDLIEMARSYRITRARMVLELLLPSIKPFMLANARVAFSLGIRLVIVAEVVGLPDGVGQQVRFWFDQLQLAPVVAWGVLLMLIGVLVDKVLFGFFERRHDRRMTVVTAAAA